MNKQEFLKRIEQCLSGFDKVDIDERINFYSEMIDDIIEDGKTEQQAISEIGSVDSVLEQILQDIPLSKLVSKKIKPLKKLNIWRIVLLVLGSPVWLSILIALLAVIVSVFILLWSVIVSLWAVLASLIACAVGAVASSFIWFNLGFQLTGIIAIAAALICAGLTIFSFFGCRLATKGILYLTKKAPFVIKSLFI